MHGGLDLSRYPDQWAITRTLFKRHAACYLTHSSIENTLALIHEHGLTADDVERASISVAPLLDSVCNIHNPETGLELKFSLRATTALALLGYDTGDPATFSDVIADPGNSLRSATGSPSAPMVQRGLRRRRRSSSRHARATNSERRMTPAGRPPISTLKESSCERKFLLLTAPVLGADRATEVVDTVNRLEQLPDIRSLMSLVSTRGA